MRFWRMTLRPAIALATGLSFLLASCGGGDSGASGSSNGNGTGVTNFYTPPPTDAAHVLSAADVTAVVSRAVAEAQARNAKATIAVTDRVGNVLAVYQMAGAAATAHIPEAPDGSTQGVQGVNVPSAAAAIAKAITGAYLSSSGNAFSTRTASQIVQEHFPPSPSAAPLPSGPLFGVQFSQLPCSDLNTRLLVNGATMGPKRSPLGLAADPGGFPLYKGGVVVGGVGVITDGTYGFDPDSTPGTDPEASNTDEYVALAATQGFAAPDGIRADKISVGVFLVYSEADYALVKTNSASVALASTGAFVPVPGYYDGSGTLNGVAYGVASSGYRPAGADYDAASFPAIAADAYVLTNPDGTNRFPATASTDGGATPLTQNEVRVLLEEAFKVLRRERAAIRQPSGSRSQVTISVVDRNGTVLGIVRSPDAPVFGTDVSLQKARTAAFFSSDAATPLTAAGFGSYVNAAKTFFARTDAFSTWGFAFGDRSIGSIARPLFPDGQPGTTNGPFSVPVAKFSPFATGLQTDLILGNLVTELTAPASQPATCTTVPTSGGKQRLANGIQIFPGSVPIYRGSTLVGGIGISGDGVTQDDMVAYLGLNNAAARLGSGGIANAPPAIRSNTLSPPAAGGSLLQYVICPQGPFVDSTEQNPCPDVPHQ